MPEDKAEAPKAPTSPTSPGAKSPKGRGKGGKGKGGGKGRGKGGGRPSGAKGHLIEQVKSNQRSDPGWRRAWGNYCQAHGGDVRDPSKHALDWLNRALKTLGRPQGGGQGGYGGGYAQARASPHVVEQVKMNQRTDPGWNQAWANFCMVNGGGVSDPSRHSDRWLIRACQTLGPPQVAYQYMDSMGMVQTVSVPMQGGFLPQQQMGYGGGYGGGYQQRGSYPRSRGGGYGGGGGGRPRSRGGYVPNQRPRSRGGYVPNMGQRGGLSSRGGGQRGGLRSRGGGGGGGGAPRSRGGGGGGGGRPRSRGGYRPQ